MHYKSGDSTPAFSRFHLVLTMGLLLASVLARGVQFLVDAGFYSNVLLVSLVIVTPFVLLAYLYTLRSKVTRTWHLEGCIAATVSVLSMMSLITFFQFFNRDIQFALQFEHTGVALITIFTGVLVLSVTFGWPAISWHSMFKAKKNEALYKN